MKKLLLLLIPFLFTITAYSQNGYSSVFLRVTDSATFVNSANTVAKHAANYADIWYSVNSGLFWKWSTVTNTYTQLGSDGWPLTGTANFTGDVTIDNGVHNLLIGDITGPYSSWDIDGSGPASLANSKLDGVGDPTGGDYAYTISQLSGIENGVVMSSSFPAGGSAFVNALSSTTSASAAAINANGTSDAQVFARSNGEVGIRTATTDRLLIDTDGSWDLGAGFDPGTATHVLTSNGAGSAPTWQAASGGGGATAAGATGNMQYKSAGGGLQAEAALTYDSATNTLTVANVANAYTALTDGAAITITGSNHTLTSTQAAVTWTLSQTGNYSETWITLNATSSTHTFPAGALCVSDGVSSGNNTATLSGVSGDKYVMVISKNGTDYRVVLKNFGQ